MKKIFALILMMTFFCISGAVASSVYASEISVYLNDIEIETEVAPDIIDGRTVVPVREICDALGCIIEWDSAEKTVTIERDNVKNILTIGKTEAKKIVDGVEQQVMLQVPAQIISDKTMVPVRYISESIGADVYWDSENKRVAIYMNEAPGLRLSGEGIIHINDYAYTLPTPGRIDTGKNGLEWYVYNANYEKYKMIAVKDGIVVGFYTLSNGFNTNIGVKFGVDISERNVFGYDITIYRDANKAAGVLVIKKDCFGNADKTSQEYIQCQSTQLFEITNAFRVANGLGVLGWDEAAGYVAGYHSDEMAVHNFYSHTGIDGKGVLERYTDKSTVEWTAIGENISSGKDCAIDIMEDFIASPGQKAHILSPAFKYFGAGVAYANLSEYKYYATQVFVAY